MMFETAKGLEIVLFFARLAQSGSIIRYGFLKVLLSTAVAVSQKGFEKQGMSKLSAAHSPFPSNHTWARRWNKNTPILKQFFSATLCLPPPPREIVYLLTLTFKIRKPVGFRKNEKASLRKISKILHILKAKFFQPSCFLLEMMTIKRREPKSG